MDSWKTTGAADIKDVANDLQKLNKDIQPVENALENGQTPGSDGNTMAGDIGALLGDTYRIKLKDMPPACVPGLDSDYQALTGDLANVGSALTLFVGAANQGNTINATADLDVGTTDLQQATTEFQTVSTDFSNYNASASAP